MLLRSFLPYGWYVNTQLFCYFIWGVTLLLLSNRFYKNESSILRFSLIFAGLMIYAYYRRISGVTSTTYITVFSFLAGAMYAHYFPLYKQFIKKMFFPIELFLLLIVIYLAGFSRDTSIVSVVRINVSSILFAIFCSQLLFIIDLKTKLLLWLGSFSYELYILQGLAQCIFNKTYFCKVAYLNINNPYLSLMLTFAALIPMALTLHQISIRFNKLFDNIFSSSYWTKE